MAAKYVLKNKKIPTILIAVFLILVTAISGTVAYIFSVSDTAVNEFTPANVSCRVQQTSESGVTSDVKVENTGNVDAFIRATAVITWTDDKGNILSSAPIEGTDFSITLGDSSWAKGSGGFYYYTASIAPTALTKTLFSKVTSLSSPPDGYSLNVRILASAIQANPEKSAEEAWGASVNGNLLTPN